MFKLMAWAVILSVILISLLGCSPSPQAQGQAPISKFNSRTWTLVPMSNGPNFHTACYNGHKLVLIDSYWVRENEFHLTSPKSLAIIQWGCTHAG